MQEGSLFSMKKVLQSRVQKTARSAGQQIQRPLQKCVCFLFFGIIFSTSSQTSFFWSACSLYNLRRQLVRANAHSASVLASIQQPHPVVMFSAGTANLFLLSQFGIRSLLFILHLKFWNEYDSDHFLDQFFMSMRHPLSSFSL